MSVTTAMPDPVLERVADGVARRACAHGHERGARRRDPRGQGHRGRRAHAAPRRAHGTIDLAFASHLADLYGTTTDCMAGRRPNRNQVAAIDFGVR